MAFSKVFGALVRSASVPKVIEKSIASNHLLKGTPTQVLQVRNNSQKNYGSRYGFANWQQKKDFHRRECVRDNYAERMRINTIRKNTILPVEIREAADKQVTELPRDSNPIRLVPRCVFTSRPRGVRTKYRSSRIVFRSFADAGQVGGVTRACW